MSDKEVVFISNFMGNGGAARVISVLAGELAKRGYEVSICSFSYAGSAEYAHLEEVNYTKIETRYKHAIFHKIERILRLRKEIKKHKNAVVISFEYFMNMQVVVSMLGLKNRLIVSERNDPERVGGKTPIKQIRNFLYRFVDCLVCQTEDAANFFPRGIRNKSVVILNPIKADLPEPFIGTRKKQIVNFCRLEKQKNLPLLIDSFEEFRQAYPDYTLAIYGDGKEHDFLKEYIHEKHLENTVSLYPAVQNIHECIIDSMMFVSSSDYEGLSNSMIEAMAIGLPTICTDCPCGGARMVIKDGVNGLLVPVGDKHEMIKAMKKISENPQLGEKLGREAFNIYSKLSPEAIAEEWIQII